MCSVSYALEEMFRALYSCSIDAHFSNESRDNCDVYSFMKSFSASMKRTQLGSMRYEFANKAIATQKPPIPLSAALLFPNEQRFKSGKQATSATAMFDVALI